MDPKPQEQLDEQEIKLNEILTSVKKTERYMKWTFWFTVIVFVLPLILLALAVPVLIRTYTSTLAGLEGII